MDLKPLLLAILTLCVFTAAQPKFDILVEPGGIRKDDAKTNYSTDCIGIFFWRILSTKEDFGLILTRPDNALTNPRIKQAGFTLMIYNTGTRLPKNISEKTIKQGEMTFFLADKTTLKKSLEPSILNSPNDDGTVWLQFTPVDLTKGFVRKLLLQKTDVRVQVRVSGKEYDEVLPVPLLITSSARG